MSDLSAERARYMEILEQDLKCLPEQLRRIPEVRKVVLFGSCATGRRDLLTDIDLLVIIDSSADFVTRSAELAGQLHARAALDLLVYTPEEIEQMADRPFIREAMRKGKVLYERELSERRVSLD